MEVNTNTLLTTCAVLSTAHNRPVTPAEIAVVLGTTTNLVSDRLDRMASRSRDVCKVQSATGRPRAFRLRTGTDPVRLAGKMTPTTQRAVDIVNQYHSNFGPMSGAQISVLLGRVNRKSKVAHLLTEHIRQVQNPQIEVVNGDDGVTRFRPVQPAGLNDKATTSGRNRIPADTMFKAVALVNAGFSVSDVAKKVGVSKRTVYNYLRDPAKQADLIEPARRVLDR